MVHDNKAYQNHHYKGVHDKHVAIGTEAEEVALPCYSHRSLLFLGSVYFGTYCLTRGSSLRHDLSEGNSRKKHHPTNERKQKFQEILTSI